MSPAVIVIPDLDTPGMNAKTWDNPIKIPSATFMSSIDFVRRPIASAMKSKIPIRIETIAIIGMDLTGEIS